MTLHARVRIGQHTEVGLIEIHRVSNLDDVALLPSVVSTYAVAVDGLLVGHLDHRYGDGAWALLAAGADLASHQLRPTRPALHTPTSTAASTAETGA